VKESDHGPFFLSLPSLTRLPANFTGRQRCCQLNPQEAREWDIAAGLSFVIPKKPRPVGIIDLLQQSLALAGVKAQPQNSCSDKW